MSLGAEPSSRKTTPSAADVAYRRTSNMDAAEKKEEKAGDDAGETNDMNTVMKAFFQMMKSTVTAANDANSAGGQQGMNEFMFAAIQESGETEVPPRSATANDVTTLEISMEISGWNFDGNLHFCCVLFGFCTISKKKTRWKFWPFGWKLDGNFWVEFLL